MSDAMTQALQDATTAVEGRNLDAGVQAAVEGLPEPPSGYVRLYRWEGEGAVKAGAAGGKEGGVWWETSPGVYYTPGTPASAGKYVDIPEAQFKKLQADPNATEVQLPTALSAKAKPLVEATVVGPARAKSRGKFDPEKHSLADWTRQQGIAFGKGEKIPAELADVLGGRKNAGKFFRKEGGLGPGRS